MSSLKVIIFRSNLACLQTMIIEDMNKESEGKAIVNDSPSGFRQFVEVSSEVALERGVRTKLS